MNEMKTNGHQNNDPKKKLSNKPEPLFIMI